MKTIKNAKEEMSYVAVCESCGAKYDIADESREVQEGGIHICPECWEEE